MQHLLVFSMVVLSGAAVAAQNPEKVADVTAGSERCALVSWWGFDPEDSTEYLQSAIDSGAPRVVVPYVGEPWIVRPIKLRGHLELVFEPGVVVLAKAGEFKGKGDSLFSVSDAENIRIRGYGATLRMRKADYQSDAYEKAEWRMTLALRGCTNVTVEGVRLESSGGDGIYIGCTGKQHWCENVAIRDVACLDHHRQGISVIGAVNLLIENCVMSGTDGTAPQAGIDLEPNNPEERLENCVIRNCTFENNTGPGMLLYLRPLSRESEPVSVLFEDCHVGSGRSTGICVGAVKDDGPQGSIVFKNCTVENTRGNGAYVYDKSAGSASVVFDNCKWNNVGQDKREAPIRFNGRHESVAATVGAIEFINCRLYDSKKRAAVVIEGRGTKAKDIHGRIEVFADKVVPVKSGIEMENVDLQTSSASNEGLVPVALIE